MYTLIDLVQSRFEQNAEGGSESDCTLMGLDNAHCTKGRMANSILWPYGLGCQFLGLHCYACGGNKL